MPINNEALAWFAERAQTCEVASYFAFDGWRVSVKTNSAELKRELDRYYQVFAAAPGPGRTVFAVQGEIPDFGGTWEINAPGPGKKKIKEHIRRFEGGHVVKQVVRKVQTGVHLAYIAQDRICAGPLLANPNQVINFINNVYLDDLLGDNGQLFHAAGVCLGQTGIGLAGNSGKGKSTLALHLLEQGMDLVSNDRLVVDDIAGLRMRGIPKYPRINPGTVINQKALLNLAEAADVARYRALPPDLLWDLEEKYDAPVEDCFPGCRFRLSADLRIFVLLDWDRNAGGPFRLDRVTPDRVAPDRVAPDRVAPDRVTDLLPAVMKAPGVLLPRAAKRIPTVEPDDYLALLDQTELYVLTGGVDFSGAASQLKALITR